MQQSSWWPGFLGVLANLESAYLLSTAVRRPPVVGKVPTVDQMVPHYLSIILLSPHASGSINVKRRAVQVHLLLDCALQRVTAPVSGFTVQLLV